MEGKLVGGMGRDTKKRVDLGHFLREKIASPCNISFSTNMLNAT